MNALSLPPGNPMGRVAMGVLICELIVFGLAIPGMILVEHRSTAWALVGGLGAIALALLATFLLRRPVGWLLGWAAQVAGLALGLLTPWMWVLGAIFAGLWVTTFVLGRRLDAASAQRG